RRKVELARRAQIEQPGRQDTLVDEGAAPIGDALAVEGLGAQPAPLVRVVDDGDALREDGLPELLLEEAGAAGDRRAADRADEMAEEAPRDARVEDDRHLAGRDLAGAEAARRALAGALADGGGIGEVGAVDGAREIVVALHAVAAAGEDGGADAVAR